MVKAVGTKNMNHKFIVYNQETQEYYTSPSLRAIAEKENLTYNQVIHRFKQYNYLKQHRSRNNDKMLIITKLNNDNIQDNQHIHNIINKIKSVEYDVNENIDKILETRYNKKNIDVEINKIKNNSNKNIIETNFTNFTDLKNFN